MSIFLTFLLDSPKITLRPKNYTVRFGDTGNNRIDLICNAKGKPNLIQWRWRKKRLDGVIDDLSRTTNNYPIPVPNKDDNGIYMCQPINSVGSGEIAQATVVVKCELL